MSSTSTAALAPPMWPTGLKTLPITALSMRPDGESIRVVLEVPNTPENWAGLNPLGQMTTLPVPDMGATGTRTGAAAAPRTGARTGSATPLADSMVPPEEKRTTRSATARTKGAGKATAGSANGHRGRATRAKAPASSEQQPVTETA